MQYLLLAIGYFTRLPVPAMPRFLPEALNHAVKYFPLIGYLVGAVGASVFYLADYFFSPAIAVLLSMVATIYLTGAFHEDGLADSADALGGGWHTAQILAIMQDSRLGTYGVVAITLGLLIKFQALTQIPYSTMAGVLIMAHSLSRLSVIWIMASLDYVRPSGKAKPLAEKISLPALLLAHVFGLLPLLLMLVYLFIHGHALTATLQLAGALLVPTIVVVCWWRQKIKRQIGGYTGDTLGAAQQLTELSLYLGYLAWGAMQ